MEIDFNDLIVEFHEGMSDGLTSEWRWLIGTDKRVILISIIGDMFLISDKGNIYWLDVGQGKAADGCC
ncbi:MAG: hypothetical protein QM762_18175 [Chryseolinea sp.]